MHGESVSKQEWKDIPEKCSGIFSKYPVAQNGADRKGYFREVWCRVGRSLIKKSMLCLAVEVQISKLKNSDSFQFNLYFDYMSG